MSLEHFDDRRKKMSRRAKEMAKAAKVVGPSVRNLALYDETDKEKRVHVAKLLAANVKQPGFVGKTVNARTLLITTVICSYNPIRIAPKPAGRYEPDKSLGEPIRL